MKEPTYIADFDSAMGMLRSLSCFLHGRDFPLLGAVPRWAGPPMKALGWVVNRMPKFAAEQVYIWSGWLEAAKTTRLDEVDEDAIAEWIVSLYPKRRYPAIAIGSANGAATHLWAALGIPWLPQTVLTPVRRSGIDPDEPEQEFEWGRRHAQHVLRRNPDFQLHHMQDPVQDRLMVQRMSYFRFKRRVLGRAYERLLTECLAPGGTIIVVDCTLSWPVTERGERDLFQFGALGGATIDELQSGGPRVRDYLERHGSRRTKWEPPPPTRQAPEAEWGLEPSLAEDIARFARGSDWRVRRLRFEQPEALSPVIADCYRWWNEQRGIKERRLIVDSFILMEPYWTIRTGAVPFWMVFNKQQSYDALEAFLKERAFDEIYLMLFSHGVDSIGLVPIERWRSLLAQARQHGRFVGVDERAFPRDFGVYSRYHDDLVAAISARYPMPQPLTLDELDRFLATRTDGAIQWSGAA